MKGKIVSDGENSTFQAGEARTARRLPRKRMEFANCKGQKGREQASETRSPDKSLIMKGFIFSLPPLDCGAVTEVDF